MNYELFSENMHYIRPNYGPNNTKYVWRIWWTVGLVYLQIFHKFSHKTWWISCKLVYFAKICYHKINIKLKICYHKINIKLEICYHKIKIKLEICYHKINIKLEICYHKINIKLKICYHKINIKLKYVIIKLI